MVIREYLRVRPYDAAARRCMVRALAEAARTKDEFVDLINVAIGELLRQRYELPAFDTLNRAARRVRAAVAHGLYRRARHPILLLARQFGAPCLFRLWTMALWWTPHLLRCP